MGCLIQLLLAIFLIVIFPVCVILGPIGWIAFFVLLGAVVHTIRVVSGRGG